MKSMYIEYTKEEIVKFESEIENFCNSKGINLKPQMDLVRVGKDLGFKMYSLTLPFGIDGVISIGKGAKRIGVNNRLKHMNSRRVIAHELGHYIRQLTKHEGQEDTLLFAMKDSIFHDEQKSKEENEMDYYAAAILVPMDGFVKRLEELNISGIHSLSQIDNVSLVDRVRLAEIYDVEVSLIERRIVEACKYVG